jgi:hypothetical protein
MSFLARLECLSRGDLAGAAAVKAGRVPKGVRDATEAILAGLEDEGALLKEDPVARAKRWAARDGAGRVRGAAWREGLLPLVSGPLSRPPCRQS